MIVVQFYFLYFHREREFDMSASSHWSNEQITCSKGESEHFGRESENFGKRF